MTESKEKSEYENIISKYFNTSPKPIPKEKEENIDEILKNVDEIKSIRYKSNFEICDDCNERTLIMCEGCSRCLSCGYSKCSK